MKPYPTVAHLLLDYEIRSSWIIGLCFFDWQRSLAARYLSWKTQRKMRRWQS